MNFARGRKKGEEAAGVAVCCMVIQVYVALINKLGGVCVCARGNSLLCGAHGWLSFSRAPIHNGEGLSRSL